MCFSVSKCVSVPVAPDGGSSFVSVLQCVATFYSVLHCVAACCSVLQCPLLPAGNFCIAMIIIVAHEHGNTRMDNGEEFNLNYGLATISRLLKIVGLFFKRAL